MKLAMASEKPRITETDINIIDEWLTEMATDPIKAISSHTGDETMLIARMTKQLLAEKDEEIEKWVEAYSQY